MNELYDKCRFHIILYVYASYLCVNSSQCGIGFCHFEIETLVTTRTIPELTHSLFHSEHFLFSRGRQAWLAPLSSSELLECDSVPTCTVYQKPETQAAKSNYTIHIFIINTWAFSTATCSNAFCEKHEKKSRRGGGGGLYILISNFFRYTAILDSDYYWFI